MKKQYLISLLGFFAIFIPFGSGLVNTNLNSSNNEKTTGITMKETSKIFVIDKDNSNDVTTSDTINSIYFEGEWMFENWGGKENYDFDDPSEEGLNLYSSQRSDEPILEVSYKTLKNKGTSNLSEDSEILTYNIEANSLNNENVGIWGYQIGYKETFEITADYNSAKEPKIIKEDNLGIIELALSDPSTIKQTSDVEVTITPLEAKVDYKVTPGFSNSGNLETVESVRWTSEQGIQLASSEKEEGTLLAKSPELGINMNYEHTTLQAKMSGGWTETVEVELFDTIPKDEPSKITSTNHRYAEEITPTTAKTNYEVIPGKDVNGEDVTVETVIWMDGGNELAIDEVNEGSGIDGTLYATELKPNHSYENTTIFAYMSDGTSTNTVKLHRFWTKKGDEPSSIEQVGEVEITSSTEANVSYIVTPGKNNDGETVTVERVRWIDGRKPNGTWDVIAVDHPKNNKGTLKAKDLKVDQLYEGTTIIADMSDGSSTGFETVNSFTAGDSPSTVEQVEDVVVTDYNSAHVDYNVNYGKDDVKVNEVRWMEGETILGSSYNKKSGTLRTSKLKGNQCHETRLIAFMDDGTTTEEVIIESFWTEPCNEPSTIKEDGIVNVTSSTEANVSYDVAAGKDVWGDPVTVEKVEWKNGDEVLATDEVNTENEIDGILETDKLSPNQSYDNTKIIATMSDESEAEAVPLEPFKAEPGNVDSTIEEVGKVEVTSSTEANVSYAVTVGKDVWGNDITATVEKVEWKNGDEVLATDEVNTKNEIDGTLETDKLSPNQPYNNTKIIATMSDESETEAVPLEPFKVDPGNVDSTIEEMGKVEVTSSTEANVSYAVTAGKDVWGNPVTVEKVEWKNGDEVLATDEVNTENEIDGILETDKLSPNQSYDNTKIIATMSDGIPTRSVKLETFQAKPGNKPSRIKEIGGVNVTSSTEANVGYTVTPGKDVWGNPVTVEKVEWKNGDEVLATDEVNTENEIDGILETDKLSPNQSYDNTKIIATMSDGIPTRSVKLETFQANASLPTNEATAINIDEGNGILQVEGKITKNETTIKEINLIDIEADESVTTKCEITDGSYSVFTDQYNGNIDNYRLQVSYEIDGKTSNLENEYKDIQNSENITEYIDLSYLIDTDDLKLGWIIAGSLIVLILCIIAVGFFVF